MVGKFGLPPKSIDPTLYDYLYQMVELLNLSGADGGANAFNAVATGAEAAVQGSGKQSASGADLEAQYDALKSLVIKTAGETRREVSAAVGLIEQGVLHLQILSSMGSIFKNGNISTTLRAIVWKGTEDVTSQYDDNAFRWYRVSDDAEGDTAWNQRNAGGTKSIHITADDVNGRATFFCDLIDTTTRKSLIRKEGK